MLGCRWLSGCDCSKVVSGPDKLRSIRPGSGYALGSVDPGSTTRLKLPAVYLPPEAVPDQSLAFLKGLHPLNLTRTYEELAGR